MDTSWVLNLLSHNGNSRDYYFCLFRAAPAAYGGSQARSQIRAAAASPHHSHSNARSEPCLQPVLQLQQTLDPLTHCAWQGIKPTTQQQLESLQSDS